jgi:hypothetical protein
MHLRCIIGLHPWVGCKCRACGMTRDDGHDWRDCNCSRCGKSRHDWQVATCAKCGVFDFETWFGAAHDGDASLCQVLLEHGANPNAADSKGRTALHHAVDDRVFLGVTRRYDPTLRDLACKYHKEGRKDVVGLLLDSGANPNAHQDDSANPTPLHVLLTKLMRELARFAEFPRSDELRAVDVGRFVEEHYVTAYEIIELLLKHGALGDSVEFVRSPSKLAEWVDLTLLKVLRSVPREHEKHIGRFYIGPSKYAIPGQERVLNNYGHAITLSALFRQ